VDARGGASLLFIHLFAAAAILISPWSGTLIGDPLRSARLAHEPLWPFAMWVILIQVTIVMAALLALTIIEWLGVQYWSRRRGHRLTPAAAWQVCAHASIGWIILAVCSGLGLILWLDMAVLGVTGAASRFPMLLEILRFCALGLGPLVGLLIFETLVYTGVSRCRFANRPRPQASDA
jgi:hypothetical protein